MEGVASASPIPNQLSMNMNADPTGRFDIAAIAASFPDSADSLLLDHYLTDRESASARVFRVYRGTPPHHHNHSDEFLYVYSGRGTFWIGDPSTTAEFRPGHLLHFDRGVVHALPEILEGPVVFLSLDTPRRDPDDIIFENPADGTPASFVRPK